MGGSAIGGDLARGAFGSRHDPALHHRARLRAPRQHASRADGPLRELLGQHRGDLACFEAAAAVGAPRVVATTGGALGDAARRDGVPIIRLPAGLQPRAAVGYMFVVAAEVAALAGAAPAIRTEIDGAAAHLREARDALVERAGVIAEELHGSFPVIYGADLTDPGRVPLEDADQRERKDPGVRRPAAGDGPQRDRRLGRGA